MENVGAKDIKEMTTYFNIAPRFTNVATTTTTTTTNTTDSTTMKTNIIHIIKKSVLVPI